MSEPTRGRKPRPRPPIGIPGGSRRGRPAKQLAFWVVLFLILLLSFQHWKLGRPSFEPIFSSQFIREVDIGNIKSLTFVEKEVQGELAEERDLAVEMTRKRVKHFRVNLPFEDPDLLQRVQEKNPEVVLNARRPQAKWVGVLVNGLPFVAMIVLWRFLMRQRQGGGNSA